MSLTDDVIRYYAARAPIYDESAGYTERPIELSWSVTYRIMPNK